MCLLVSRAEQVGGLCTERGGGGRGRGSGWRDAAASAAAAADEIRHVVKPAACLFFFSWKTKELESVVFFGCCC